MEERAGGAEADARLVSHLSHQLRNPLAVIVGYAELVGARAGDTTRVEGAARIAEAADVLSHAIDEVLTLFVIEAGLLALDPAPVELEGALAETLGAVREQADRHTFIATCANESWPLVAADSEHLPRILMNVLTGAVRWSPGGGEVRISVDEDAKFAEVSVSTNGVGPPPEQLEKALDRSSALDVPQSSDSRASGLELYTARRLAEAHGGSVSTEAEPQAGSTLRLRIPLAMEDAE